MTNPVTYEPVSALAPLTAAAAQGDDLLLVVDIHDTTQAPTGTTKNMTLEQVRRAIFAGGTGFTATDPLTAGAIVGTSATLTGAAQSASLVVTGSSVSLNTVAYAWPSAQGAAGTFLKNDGSGNLSWVTETASMSLAALSDVTLAAPATGQVLVYNSGTSKWNNSTVTAITQVGVIASGTWQGTAVGTAYTVAQVVTVTGTANRLTIGGTGTAPTFDIAATYVGQSSLTTLGTIGTGTWQGSIVGATYGGTGVNNGASTLTMGGSHTLSGAFASTFTFSGITSVTFPTSGTLVNSAVTTLSSLVSVGTITTGVWNGTAIANAYIASGLDVAKLTVGTTLPSNVVSSSLTSFGTITSGAVPASLVTAGTFGAGAYTFPAGLTLTGALSGVTTLAVTGAATFFSTLAVTGAATVNANTAGETIALTLNQTGAGGLDMVMARVGGTPSSWAMYLDTSTNWGLYSNGGNRLLVSNTGAVTMYGALSGVTDINYGSTYTAQSRLAMNNSGGTLYIGMDNSTGTYFGTAGNYATIIYRPAATGFAISRTGTVDFSLSSTGAATFSSTLDILGATMRVQQASGATSELLLNQVGVVQWHIRNNATSGMLDFFTGGVQALSMTTGGAVTVPQTLAVTGGFGCNGAAAQTAYASGGAAPAGGTGTAAGGWDTAGHRDSAITLLNNIRTALVNAGMMS